MYEKQLVVLYILRVMGVFIIILFLKLICLQCACSLGLYVRPSTIYSLKPLFCFGFCFLKIKMILFAVYPIASQQKREPESDICLVIDAGSR